MQTCHNLVTRRNGREGHARILGGMHMTTTRNQKYRVPEALVCHLLGWCLPEMFEEAVHELYVMQLTALPELNVQSPLSETEVRCIAHHLDTTDNLTQFTSGVVVANRPYEGPDVEAIRSKLLEDYSDSVFSNKHNPGPPIRGPFGLATIELYPGVTTVKQRHF